MHLITGFAGTDHVTSANDGVRNAQIFGEAKYVLNIGNKLGAVKQNNNTIRIYDGYGIMDGRFFEIPRFTYEDVTIDNGTQSQDRIDLICVRYEKNTATGIETASLVVIKGTPSAGIPQQPTYHSESILRGYTIVDFPLYKVLIKGLVLQSVTEMFEILPQGVMGQISEINRLLEEEVEDRKNTSIKYVENCKYAELDITRTIPANGRLIEPLWAVFTDRGANLAYKSMFIGNPSFVMTTFNEPINVNLIPYLIPDVTTGDSIYGYYIFNNTNQDIVLSSENRLKIEFMVVERGDES